MRLYSDSIQIQNNMQKSSAQQRKFFPLNGKVQNSSTTAAGSNNAQSAVAHGDSAFNKLLNNLRHEKTGSEQSTETSGTETAGSQSQEELEKQKAKLKDACNNFECILTSTMLNNALENGAIKGYINVGTGEQIFREMLNEKTVEESAKSGAYGIGKILFNQLIKRLVPGV
ncbi:MAG: hypothetical protein AB2L14_15895 [Candidatus Xenobiia bacterium LiM19]